MPRSYPPAIRRHRSRCRRDPRPLRARGRVIGGYRGPSLVPKRHRQRRGRGHAPGTIAGWKPRPMTDLEPRVARLEASVSEIQTTLTRIEEKVNAKATREQVADLTVQLAEIR